MSQLPCALLFLSQSNLLEKLSCGCTLIRICVELRVELCVMIMLVFLKGNWMSSSGWSIGVTRLKVSVTGMSFVLGPFLEVSICRVASALVFEVWKCLHVGIFHLQSLEVLWNSPWLKIWICECAECRVPVQKVQTDQNGSSQCKCTCIHEFLFSLQELFP